MVQLNCHVFNSVFTLRKEAESRVFGMHIPSVTWDREFQKEDSLSLSREKLVGNRKEPGPPILSAGKDPELRR